MEGEARAKVEVVYLRRFLFQVNGCAEYAMPLVAGLRAVPVAGAGFPSHAVVLPSMLGQLVGCQFGPLRLAPRHA